MLNMLIAIMGDSYTKVSQKREISATKTKLSLVSQKPLNLSSIDSKKRNYSYLFVVTPT